MNAESQLILNWIKYFAIAPACSGISIAITSQACLLDSLLGLLPDLHSPLAKFYWLNLNQTKEVTISCPISRCLAITGKNIWFSHHLGMILRSKSYGCRARIGKVVLWFFLDDFMYDDIMYANTIKYRMISYCFAISYAISLVQGIGKTGYHISSFFYEIINEIVYDKLLFAGYNTWYHTYIWYHIQRYSFG